MQKGGKAGGGGQETLTNKQCTVYSPGGSEYAYAHVNLEKLIPPKLSNKNYKKAIKSYKKLYKAIKSYKKAIKNYKKL